MQAIVQKPKATMEGTCFLKPKASDKEKMKALPPPEDEIDPDGAPTTIVADSDDEADRVPPTPTPAPAPVKVVEEPVQEVVEEVKPKKKIVRKTKDTA
jgi:hypothetical protein